MKTYFSLLAIICLTILYTTNLPAQVSIIPKGGVSLSEFRVDSDTREVYDINPIVGYYGGLGIDVPISSGFSVLLEGLYVQKGSTLDIKKADYYTDDAYIGNDIVQVYDYNIEMLNYAEVPLLIQWKSLGISYGVYVNAGAAASFGLGGNWDFELKDIDDNLSYQGVDFNDADYLDSASGTFFSYFEELDIDFGSTETDRYELIDISAVLGGGFYFELGPGELNIDVRYVHGLASLFGTEFERYNSSLQAGLSYSIPLSGIQ